MRKINFNKKSFSALFIVFAMITGVIIQSCQTEDVEILDNGINIEKYLELGKSISKDLDNLTSELTKKRINLYDEASVREHLKLPKTSSKTSHNKNFYNLNTTQEIELKRMLEKMISKQSPEEAINYLELQFNEFASNTSLSSNDKDFLLLNSIVIKEYLIFLNKNNNSSTSLKSLTLSMKSNSEQDPSSWWDCMKNTAGKTIGRGIAGGFIIGFVSGGIAGAAGGTVVVPVVGTVVAGVGVAVVGGAVGAVRGAALGAFWAAADCL